MNIEFQYNMNQYSKKKITKSGAISIALISLLFLYFGIQFLIPSFTPESAYTKITSEVISQRMTDNICLTAKTGAPYHCYSLLFKLKETNVEYGFGVGRNLNKATNVATTFSSALIPGKEYTFFIDPKTTNAKGEKLGLNIIKDGDQILYKKDFTPFVGLPLILFGLGFLFLLYKKRMQIA
jgi:hypothetical protein